jgi:IS30 family transposase
MTRVQISNEARARIGELFAQGAPPWMIRQEAGVDRHAVLREIKRLQRPPPREPVRSPLRLSLVEREEISRGLAGGESLRAIARRLGRAPSTVSREVAGHGGRRRYRACDADRAALKAMRRPKRMKLGQCVRLRAVVEAKLELRWSPEQISGWLVEEFPDDPEMRCRTRRSTCRCSCRPKARYARN